MTADASKELQCRAYESIKLRTQSAYNVVGLSYALRISIEFKLFDERLHLGFSFHQNEK